MQCLGNVNRHISTESREEGYPLDCHYNKTKNTEMNDLNSSVKFLLKVTQKEDFVICVEENRKTNIFHVNNRGSKKKRIDVQLHPRTTPQKHKVPQRMTITWLLSASMQLAMNMAYRL